MSTDWDNPGKYQKNALAFITQNTVMRARISLTMAEFAMSSLVSDLGDWEQPVHCYSEVCSKSTAQEYTANESTNRSSVWVSRKLCLYINKENYRRLKVKTQCKSWFRPVHIRISICIHNHIHIMMRYSFSFRVKTYSVLLYQIVAPSGELPALLH